VKVKICGITNLEDALLCEKLGADALGFIFYDKSKRFIQPNSARDIIKMLSPFTLKVGVFVNEIPENINVISKLAGLNIVQLHGDETPKQIDKINLLAIKTFRISDDFNFDILNDYKNCYFLFDSYSISEYGGTGNIFNWDLIPKDLKDKFILSGGISSSNIQRIIKEVYPSAIDVSSSLEEFYGKKSREKLIEFFNYLKGIK
jgi:phosphoribosylanthranilate isomerase